MKKQIILVLYEKLRRIKGTESQQELAPLRTFKIRANLQIQCNPYQTTNGIFHRARTKNFTICMETQKTPNSQSNLEKEKESWRNQAS